MLASAGEMHALAAEGPQPVGTAVHAPRALRVSLH